MMADVSQDRRVTVVIQGSKHPALSERSRPCWALPSPVHERSGYRALRPTGYKVMLSCRIVLHGPGLASRLAHHRACVVRGARMAPSSSPSRPLSRRLRRWPTASLDRSSLRRPRPPPTNDALLTPHSPYKDDGTATTVFEILARSTRPTPADIHSFIPHRHGKLRRLHLRYG